MVDSLMRRGNFAALPFEDWPTVDHQYWENAFKRSGLSFLDRPHVDYRPATERFLKEQYSHALGWLQRQGMLNPLSQPDERWPVDIVREYLAELAEHTRKQTVRIRAAGLHRALSLMVPHSNLEVMRRGVSKLGRLSDTARKRDRLQEPAVLTELGFDLMARAEAGLHSNPRKNATVYRTGLQIALLSLRPLRMRNFCSIEIGRHLCRGPNGWGLAFDGSETKNHSPIEFSFPASLVDSLERYLAVYRPLLVGKLYTGQKLWLSYRFRPETQHRVQLDIVNATKQAFGKHVNPHLFRDCAATSIAIHDPQAVSMAAAMLGNHFATTERYYNQATTIQAGRSYTEMLNSRRKSSALKKIRRKLRA